MDKEKIKREYMENFLLDWLKEEEKRIKKIGLAPYTYIIKVLEKYNNG